MFSWKSKSDLGKPGARGSWTRELALGPAWTSVFLETDHVNWHFPPC